MNSVPRTAMAFLLATLLSVSTYPLTSSDIIVTMVMLACALVLLAVAANARKIQADGKSIGFTGGRVLPIAGLNFATFLTLLAILLAVLHGISEVLAA